MLETLRTARGVMRSLGIYYGWHQRRRSSAMDALYRRFVNRGDLVFDIGAHVGDRVAAFRRLGAKVVAVEPQPALASTLTMLYGHSSNVVIERAAVGRKAGDSQCDSQRLRPVVGSRQPLDIVRRVAGTRAFGDAVERTLDLVESEQERT